MMSLALGYFLLVVVQPQALVNASETQVGSCVCPQLPKFLTLAKQRAASHTYSDSFSCSDFSRGLVRLYRDNGIDSKVLWGTMPDGGLHEIVEVTGVLIEPQTGEVYEKSPFKR